MTSCRAGHNVQKRILRFPLFVHAVSRSAVLSRRIYPAFGVPAFSVLVNSGDIVARGGQKALQLCAGQK